METKWMIIVALFVLCYERNVSCTESKSTIERHKDTSITQPTTKETLKEEEACKEYGSGCKTDFDCCDGICQLEAPYHATVSTLASYCVQKQMAKKHCRNRACLHTHLYDPFLILDTKHQQSCSNPKNNPSLYQECEENGGDIVTSPSFAYCSCPQTENTKGSHILDDTLTTAESNQVTIKESEESVTLSSKSYSIVENETTGTDIFIATEKETEKKKVYVTDKSESATAKTKLAQDKNHGSFNQLLGGMPHASRVVWSPEKYIDLHFKENEYYPEEENGKDSFVGKEKKVKVLQSLRHKIKEVDEQIMAEKVKQETNKEIELMISSERVENEQKGHLKSFLPKHFK